MYVSLQLKLWPYLCFPAYFGQNLVAMATYLRPLQSEMSFFWIGRPQKPSVISNRILVISRRNAFMCIYRNFRPKIGCLGDAPLSFVYGSVTDEFPDGTNPISKPNSAWMCRLQLKLWPFFDFWPILAKIWLPWQRPLDPCNQKCLPWIGRPRKSPHISNRILVISRRNAFICICSNFCPKIGCHGNASLSLVYKKTSIR